MFYIRNILINQNTCIVNLPFIYFAEESNDILWTYFIHFQYECFLKQVLTGAKDRYSNLFSTLFAINMI